MAKPSVNYTFNDTLFVNPYNFVRIDFDKKPTSDISLLKSERLLFGNIEYSILTKTPLAIPDTEKVKSENEHKCYPFMRNANEQLMIPGSGIRGVIRNVYETVTDSCYSTSNDGQVITARQMNTGKAGLLKLKKDPNGHISYSLYEANYYMLKSKLSKKYSEGYGGPNQLVWNESVCPCYPVKLDNSGKYIEFRGDKLRSGDEVNFITLRDTVGNQVEYIKKRGDNKVFSCGYVAKELTKTAGEKGILVIGEDIFNKHHERIFKQGKLLSNIDSDMLKRSYIGMLKTLDIYRDKAINKNYKSRHSGYSSFERMKDKGTIPVYYKWDGTNLYLQFACIGRIAFNNSMNDLIGIKKPCRNRDRLCKACSLFGMIGNDNNSTGSRVRFADAICESEDPVMGKYTLGELGLPRPSYMPFYSTMNSNKKADKVGFDDTGVDIRGRKYYWHHQPSEDMLHAEKTNRNATMELAKAGIRFNGKLYFDGITEQELKELVWTLNFWENDLQGYYCHKIGHGKPLGLGSCKIIIERITKREFDGESYKLVNVDLDYKEPAPVNDSQTLSDLMRICNFHTMDGKDVRYPYVVSDPECVTNENDCAAHQWFTHNKINRESNGIINVHTLPYIDEDQELPAITANIHRNKQYSQTNYNNGSKNRKYYYGDNRNRKKR